MYVWSFSIIRGPMCSWEMLNFAYLTSFQKNDIGWPQQPPTEKMLRFNMIFHDSTNKNCFSKHKNEAEFKSLDDSEVLRVDFPGFKTSAASMTSVALTASMASMTSKTSFHQKIYYSWRFNHPQHPNDQEQSLFVEWIIKYPIFHWLALFLSEAVEAIQCYFFEKWWMKLNCTKSSEATSYHNSTKLLIFLPIRAI